MLYFQKISDTKFYGRYLYIIISYNLSDIMNNNKKESKINLNIIEIIKFRSLSVNYLAEV